MLDEDQAIRAWRLAIGLFWGCEHEPGGEAVIENALSFGISAYDAHFIVVARSLGVTLVTGDRRLLERCPTLTASIEEFAGIS